MSTLEVLLLTAIRKRMNVSMAGERIYGQFRKIKPWFRATEYVKNLFANFKIKIDTKNIER